MVDRFRSPGFTFGTPDDTLRRFLPGDFDDTRTLTDPSKVRSVGGDQGFQIGGGGIDYSTTSPGQSLPLDGAPTGETPDFNFGRPTLNPDGTPELFQPNLIPFSTSQSGIDFSNPFIAGLTEQLSNYATNVEGEIGQGTDEALQLASNQGRKTLDNDLTSALNSIAQRNIAGSTESSRILSDVGSRAVEGQRTAGLQAGLNEADRRNNIPAMLAQLATLGQGSKSLQADPLAPFKLTSDFISRQA